MKFLSFFILIILCSHWIFSYFVNRKAQPLIEEIKKIPTLYELSGRPSDTYFFLEFMKLDYSFAYFLYKNKLPPSKTLNSKNYFLVRKLSIILLFLDVFRGIIILLLLIFHNQINNALANFGLI